MLSSRAAIHRKHFLGLVACALAAVGCTGQGSDSDPPSGPNVLLVTIDTLRDDHCSVSGYARPTTPVLERLAAEGARFELAYAPTSTTGPTHASIFTALYPIAHGVRKNGMPLDAELPTLAETLKASGYATGAVVSSFVLDAKFGYAQGFDSYDDDFEAASATITRTELDGHAIAGAFDRRADATTRRAVELIDRLARQGAPFFAFVHYFDPHAPYVPPPEFAAKFPPEGDGELATAIAAYDAEIAFADHELGVLLRHLDESGLGERTLVVVTSDHGEGLMQHGHMKHGVHIYEEAVRVPLLFRLPGSVVAGSRLAEPVELLDLMPTILELANVPHGDAVEQGRSLAGPLAGAGRLDPERAIHLHRRHYDAETIGTIRVAGEKFGVRQGVWKYIEGDAAGATDDEAARELFHLEEDPLERVNRVEAAPEVAEALSERIAAWKLAYGRDATQRPQLSAEDIERLKALGYLN